jgi:hypothetical protein
MESTERINEQLINFYGIDTITGQAMWRIVWSDDQYEKRLTKYTDSGIELLIPEVRALPKYKQWVKSKWVLENLVVVPPQNVGELAGIKISYEPLYVFETEKGEAIFPSLDACQFIITLIYDAKGKKAFSTAKYTEDPEAGDKELKRLEQNLFGNETDVTDSLAYGEGVVVPSNYKVN